MNIYSPPAHIQLNIVRKIPTRERMGWSNSTIHVRINDGLFPPPISLGSRAVGFLSHETDAVIAAMASGKDQDEIKELVKSLVAQRKELMETLYEHQQ